MLDISPASTHSSTFAERYKVDTAKPLPEFDTVGGKAYMVVDKEHPSLPMYAFVQAKNVPARFDLMKELKSSKVPGMICPQDYGVMMLDLETRVERLVIIFDRPLGGALFQRDKVNKRLTVAILRDTVPLAFTRALAILHNRNLVHRQIRPEKVFFVEEVGNSEVVIGECVTVPAGYGMPIDLEPIELMFADEASRGGGTDAADMYQMGATLLTYFKNRPIWKNRTREVSLKTRTQHSSYLALALGEGIAGSLVTLIKGLMHDELENRWGIPDILNWFEGGKKRALPTKRSWSLNRPVAFNGQTYADRRTLADAFANFPKDAILFLQGIDFPNWASEVIRTEVLDERIELLLGVKASDEKGANLTKNDFALLSRVCMHLHPGGPVRYKGMAIQLDSIPSTVAAVLSADSSEKSSALKEMLNDKFLQILAEIVGERSESFSDLVGNVQKITGTAQSASLGRGLERVLYMLNRDMPCQSVKFDTLWIDDAGKFALALNSSVSRDFIKAAIFDRHVAAFLASRNEIYARAINSFAVTEKDPSRFAIVALEFFGALQQEFKLPTMTHLTDLLIGSLHATINELKNKKRKAKVIAMLDNMKQGGDIAKLTSQIDFGKIQALDKQGFLRAKAAVFGIDRMRKQLSHKFSANDFPSKLTGYKWLRSISFIIFIASVAQTVI